MRVRFVHIFMIVISLSRDICSSHDININNLIDAINKCERKILIADTYHARKCKYTKRTNFPSRESREVTSEVQFHLKSNLLD